MPLFLSYQGVDESGQRVEHLSEVLPELGRFAVLRWARHVRRTLKREPYPPAPPGSTYTRTGGLANSWSVRGTRNFVVRNSRPYSGFVVGQVQASMHRGRWWRAQDVADREVELLSEGFGDDVDEVLNA